MHVSFFGEEAWNLFIVAIWMFPKIVVPPKHPKMLIFSRKTHDCWVPLFLENPCKWHWNYFLQRFTPVCDHVETRLGGHAKI